MHISPIEQIIMIMILETPVPDLMIPNTTMLTTNKMSDKKTPVKNNTKNL